MLTTDPSEMPPISEIDTWTPILSDRLTAFSTSISNDIVHQPVYFELDVATNDPWNVNGSCLTWSAVVSDVSTANLLYNPVSIRMSAIVGDPSDATRFVEEMRSCNESTALAIISNNFAGGRSSAAALSAGVSTQCGDSQWTVKLCPGASLASICVDCEDPCLSTLHCKNATTGTQETLFSLSPCVPQSCAVAARSTAIRLLSVDYVECQISAESYLNLRIVRIKSWQGGIYLGVIILFVLAIFHCVYYRSDGDRLIRKTDDKETDKGTRDELELGDSVTQMTIETSEERLYSPSLTPPSSPDHRHSNDVSSSPSNQCPSPSTLLSPKSPRKMGEHENRKVGNTRSSKVCNDGKFDSIRTTATAISVDGLSAVGSPRFDSPPRFPTLNNRTLTMQAENPYHHPYLDFSRKSVIAAFRPTSPDERWRDNISDLSTVNTFR